MKNDLNNLRKFVALYWGQNVGCTSYVKNFKISKSNILNVEFLLLKSLSDISDEDALDVYKVLYPDSIEDEDFYKLQAIEEFTNNKCIVANSKEIAAAIDAIRSKGYLIDLTDYQQKS